MIIDHVEIAGYKSLYNVRLEPGGLLVLAGPNNAGKSNLVEALDFLTDTYTHGIELAVSRKGGFENIAFRRKRRTRRPISFTVKAQMTARESHQLPRRTKVGIDPNLEIEHAFALEATSRTRDTDFEVSAERFDVDAVGLSSRNTKVVRASRQYDSLEMSGGASKRLFENRLDDLVSPFNERGFLKFAQTQTSNTDLIIEAVRFNLVARRFAEEMGRNRTFQLSPLECRKPGVPTPNPQLDRHGENLPALVRYLKRLGRPAWPRVLDGLRRLVPDLDDVELEFTQDRRLSLRFVEVGTGRPWSSQEISDGTIQTLAILCVLHDPRSALVVIEEPENSVHPWIIRVLLDECRKARKQILLTTHSPVLLSEATPQEVSVVWKDAGRSRVEPLLALEPDAQSMWESGELSVYDILDTGWLRQGVPPSSSIEEL